MRLVIFALGFFTLALALPYVVTPLLKKLQLVDTPNHRTSHTKPTIRGGGLAVALAITIGLVVSLFAFDLEVNNFAVIATVLLTVAFTATLGFVEDTRGISVIGRLGWQFLLAVAVALLMLYLTDQHLLWAIPLSLAGVFCINAANFMDGINGISSMHGILLGSTALIVGILESNTALITVGTIIALSFLGFLPWNFPTARMFLGDVGSYVLGGLFFAVGFWVYFATGSLFLAVAPGLYYIFDVVLTLIVRKRNGKDLTESHKDHLYQQFQQGTGSHLAATLTVSGISLFIILLALLSYTSSMRMWLSLSLSGAVLLLFYALGKAKLGAPRTDSAPAHHTEQVPTIGILTQWYDPEVGGARLPGALARGLVARGYQVKVLTGVPNYPHGSIYPGFVNRFSSKVDESGILVTRVPLYMNHSGSSLKRALNYISFAISARTLGRNALSGVDLIWVYNSPPSIVYPLRNQKKRTGAPVFTHIMDLWPDSFTATDFSMGLLQRLALKYFDHLTTQTYLHSDRIAFISPGIRQVLVSRGLNESQLTYIPTWVEPEKHTKEFQSVDLGFRPTTGKRTLVYAGAIGSVQRLDLIIDALMARPELPIELLIIGTGTAKEELADRAHLAENITFLPPVAPQEMHEVYRIADLMLISLGSSELSRTSTPSKFSQILEQRKPVVAIGEGDLLEQVSAAGAGVVANPNQESIINMLEEVARATDLEIESWGNSGGEFFEKNLSYSTLIDRISSEFGVLLAQGRSS